MKASVLTEYGRLQWMECDTPGLSPNGVLINVSCAGICGSDMHVFKGEFHPRTPLPLIMGHEFAGTIVDIGSEVSGFDIGDRVTVDPIFWCGHCPACERQHYPACSSLKLLGIDSNGGFGQYVAAPEFMLYKLDDRIPDQHAALIEMLSIGFHACQRAGVQPGDTLAIFGAGRIGQSILQAARTITDNTITLVDIVPNRLQVASDIYDNVVPVNALEHDPARAIAEATNGRGVDVALEAVGHPHPIEGRRHPVAECVDVVRGAGTVCVLGLGDTPVSLLMKDLIWKEVTVVASRVTHGEFAKTIEHMSRGDLHPEALITREMPACDAQQAFELLLENPKDDLKILLHIA